MKLNVDYGNIPIIYEKLTGSVKQKSDQWNGGMTYLNGLTQSISVVFNMSMIFGLALSPMMMSKDALGLGSCQIRTNISVVFMMLNRNIAENIPDHGHML